MLFSTFQVVLLSIAVASFAKPVPSSFPIFGGGGSVNQTAPHGGVNQTAPHGGVNQTDPGNGGPKGRIGEILPELFTNLEGHVETGSPSPTVSISPISDSSNEVGNEPEALLHRRRPDPLNNIISGIHRNHQPAIKSLQTIKVYRVRVSTVLENGDNPHRRSGIVKG
ncbi:hypothetical protein M408DRAFT_27891 [Serendipita vermifera MAFF 305830]|uniref:Uncharacterized protein n=1 Tax=Serendipita vermifera MAFF 305830 TaxID=933852 RepID=A0A0C2X1U1_SERVB|nr:hypothetical protein M408DRAFT_27891 [Serendipita vermifera MAFF 305830]